MSGKAQADFFEFLEANSKPILTLLYISNPNTMTWRRPEARVVKINVDAAVSEATSTIGIGVIARDEFGLILGILVKNT